MVRPLRKRKEKRGKEKTKRTIHHCQSHSQPTQPRDWLFSPQSRRTTNQGMSGCCCFLRERVLCGQSACWGEKKRDKHRPNFPTPILPNSTPPIPPTRPRTPLRQPPQMTFPPPHTPCTRTRAPLSRLGLRGRPLGFGCLACLIAMLLSSRVGVLGWAVVGNRLWLEVGGW